VAHLEVAGVKPSEILLLGPANAYIGLKTNRIEFRILPTGSMTLDLAGMKNVVEALQSRIDEITDAGLEDGRLLDRPSFEFAKKVKEGNSGAV
jgi:hypothetical protein